MTIAIHNRRAVKSTMWDVIAMLTLALRSAFISAAEKENILGVIVRLKKAMVGM